MTKILIVVILAMIVHLVLLTYKTWRLERKNRELNDFLHGHTPTKKEEAQIQNEECILQTAIMGMEWPKTYVGKLSELKRMPKEGDFASDDKEMYFYTNGKWRRIIDDLPRINLSRYNY